MLGAIQTIMAQSRLLDRSGKVSFFSEAPMENIEAVNNQSLAIFDSGTNTVAASLLMKGFRFEKALMEEHFNENYVESDKYPKATFSGKMEKGIKIDSIGSVRRRVDGILTLHGVSKPVSCLVQFEVSEELVEVRTSFMVMVEDYEIKVPSIVAKNIAEEIEVTANFKFKK